MDEQLALIRDEAREWRLDERTRRVGREGVERARSALRKADRRGGPDGPGPATPGTPATKRAA